jgi:hypothetical protein
MIEALPIQMLNGPFGDFFTTDIVDHILSARDFCETFYDRFRSFFFVCHPLNGNSISRKKRHSLFAAFILAAQSFCHTFYAMDHSAFVAAFDALLIADVYKPAELSVPSTRVAGELTLSENTRVELDSLQALATLAELPPPAPLRRSPAGIVSAVDLRQDAFVALVEGYVADLEEFTYDDGVDAAFFQIADTRFVLDIRDAHDPLLLQIERSMLGNVVIRLVRVGRDVKAGLFIGRTPSRDIAAQMISCFRQESHCGSASISCQHSSMTSDAGSDGPVLTSIKLSPVQEFGRLATSESSRQQCVRLKQSDRRGESRNGRNLHRKDRKVEGRAANGEEMLQVVKYHCSNCLKLTDRWNTCS